MGYRFVPTGGFFGPASEQEMGALPLAQLLAVLADSGESATSMREWSEQLGAELDQSPDLSGFELWDVFEDEAKEPRFTLLYFNDCDSGLLLHAGTANPVGLALWPEGFKPKPPDADVTGIDIEALSRAYELR